MSNSVIKSYVDVSGSVSNSGRQLVLLVNKDGSLSLEKNVLQSLTEEKNPENISVSLVHVNEDGKPKGLCDEGLSDEDDVPHINLTVNAFYDAKADADSKAIEDELISRTRDLFLVSFHNDHCYTPHTLPDDDPSLIQTDVLPETKSNIPSSKKITILENKIIPKGKKLINLNTPEGQVVLKRSDILKKIAEAQKSNTTSIIASAKASLVAAAATVEKIQEPALLVDTPAIPVREGLVKVDKSNTSFQNEYIKNLSKSCRTGLIDDNIKSLLTKKIESRKASAGHDGVEQSKYSKTYSPRSSGSDGHKASIIKKSKKPAESVHKEEAAKPDPSKMHKASKKKPTTPHSALLSDMTSLFSTPDVLRRVSTDVKSPKSADPTVGHVSKSDSGFESEDVNKKSEIRTYSNTNNKSVPLPSVKKDYNKSLSIETPISEVLSGMGGTPHTSAGEDMMQVDSGNLLLSPSGGINVPLSPGLDILGGIQAEEEGLSEDLLMHVAQLVESSEKLQEVIDTQVLGKVDNMQTTLPDPLPILPERQPVRKEPIQIVRSNGRVITLPPIEAPATRASKRKSLINSTLEQPPAAPVVKVAVVPQPTVISSPSPTPTKPAVAVTKKSIKPAEKPPPPPPEPELEEQEHIESDESWNSEDDPDRLWCICKQPHNNRFMICCDMCEDWFHGKCVNITKSMGQEMEEKGIEWRCPTCVKKRNLAKGPPKPSSPRKSLDNKSEASVESDAYSHLAVVSEKPSQSSGAATICIVCKKTARHSSIYCSDACILKHAQESLNVSQPNKQNVSKEDFRVIVYERKTGKCLAGPSAPTAANLRTWLREHPTFEVVRPGTIKSANASHSKIGAQKVQSVLKISDDKQIMLVQPEKSQPQHERKQTIVKNQHPLTKQTSVNVTTPKAITKTVDSQLKSPTEHSPKLQLKIPPKQAAKTYVKTPTTPKTPTQQQKQAPLKSPTTPVSHKKEESRSRSSGIDPIRENVRKTLQEQLSIRMSETKNIKLTPEEITQFALNTELELHDLFKDVGVKYKAKYRSLMFNLKDRKNLSLWEKICDKTLSPKQLVRLSPEELASQELAQWRDQEAKHQLELIKKSELDLLACNKTYVLKTHKGEEVIESKSLPTTELDPNVTLEDIVSALNQSQEEENKKHDEETKSKDKKSRDSRSLSRSPSLHRRHSERSTSSSRHKHSRNRSRSRSKSSRRRKSRSSDRRKSSSKHDSKSSSRSHKRSSTDKSRSDRHSDSSKRSHGDSHHSSSSKHHHTSRSKNHDRDTVSKSSSKRSSSKDRSSRRSRSKDRRRHSSKDNNDKISSEIKRSSPKESDKHHHKKSESNKDNTPLGKLDIDEKLILKASEDTDILLPPMVESGDVASPPSPRGRRANRGSTHGAMEESDQEPSSTVDSTPLIVWSGTIGMVDVAKFNVSMFEMSGSCDSIVKDLKAEMEIVGRIQPDTVWDYIEKMRKSNKEIILTKILPADEAEQAQHTVFYNYLNSRNRLAVVKAQGGSIKDFYILPLPSTSVLPKVLLPMRGSDLDEFRSDLLVGVIIGQKRKRSSTAISAIPTKMSKLKEKEERSYTPPGGSYTPPRSPKAVLPYPHLPSLSSSVKHQIAVSLASADDEPYSPGGGSDSISHSPTDLHRKMEELDRKIEERKKQIQSISGNMTTDVVDEPYSPSRPMSPESNTSKSTIPLLSDISLPSNLQEILATIHQKTAGAAPAVAQDAYVPTAVNVDVTTASTSLSFKESVTGDVDMRVLGSSYNQVHSSNMYMPTERPSTSKLSSLSEAELLSMVPDNEVFPPLPPMPLHDLSVPPPPYKKIKIDREPPPPGLEDDN